jgi:integrase
MKNKMGCDPEDWKGGDKLYLFHGGNGEQYYPNTPSLTWRRFLIKHELPHIRIHDLRHTTAMLLREYGADLKTIQEQLRHSKLATTTDIYMQRDRTTVSRGSADLYDVLNPKNQLGHQTDTKELM